MKFRVKKYRRRRRARQGRSITYLSNNKIYFVKGKQRGRGVVTRLLAKALQGVRDIIDVWMRYNKFRFRKKRRGKRKQKGKGIFSNAAKGIQNYFNALHKAYQWDEKEIMRWWN